MKTVLKLLTSVTLISSIGLSFNSKASFFSEEKNFSANIQSLNISSIDLALLDGTYLGKMDLIDLTSLTGISSVTIFKKFFSAIELPNLEASISLFNTVKDLSGFSFSTINWQENWKSDTMRLVEGSETIGSAYIYGILSTRIEIIKHPQINHLLIRIHFYGTGDYASTATHPYGRINSGWVLNLIPAKLNS